eukprot:m.67860 g.67860  ORF g.67860 m.67860 type:complete len:611 (+) comp18257_c0_seq1:15-1847(+)
MWVGVITVLTVFGSEATQQCGISTNNNTLGYLAPDNVTLVAARDAAACCAACLAMSDCASWSQQNQWTPQTPCHLSPYQFVKIENKSSGNSCGSARPPPPNGPNGVFLIDTSPGGRRQVFEGVQVELMSDSIGSDNTGMPGDGTLVPDDSNTTIGCPHDLTSTERVRFATEVLRGVRTIRLALGLYLRGVSANGKNIVGRWPSQMTELKQLQELSEIEGWAPEYWSPPPSWKDSNSYYSGTLSSFNASFLEEFSDAVLGDVSYLRSAGLNIKWWGLQNEPNSAGDNITCLEQPADTSMRVESADVRSLLEAPESKGNSYAMCHYKQCDYYHAFVACAKKIRALDSSIRIHANSETGQRGGAPIANDPATLPLVDAWTHHTVNCGSDMTFGNQTAKWNYGKFDFTNEMEYQPGNPLAGTPRGTVAIVNTFLNTLTFKNSPTGVMMLHAIKPTTNAESLGYGWTWWRSTGTPSVPAFPNLAENHFTYNWWNWNSVAPFIKTVPWNSMRLNVMEDTQRVYQRVVAFSTPASGSGGPLHPDTVPNKLIVVLTNEGAVNFTTTVQVTDGLSRRWAGYSYTGSVDGSGFNVSIGLEQSATFNTTLEPFTVQWWYEQ